MQPQQYPQPPTYPQAPQPMPAPQAWPQPPQQPYPPQPQYAPPAPAPQQYAAPAPVAPPMPSGPGADEFSNPTPVMGNIARPRLMDLGEGRLVFFRPTKIERDVPAPPRPGEVPKVQDRITTDIIPLDGGQFAYGGKPEKGVPHTAMGTPGDIFPSCWNSNKIMVAQLERSVDPSARLYVLGRLIKVQGANLQNNPSWRLADPTEEDRAIARAWKARYDAGQIPASAGIAAPAPAPQQQYASVPQQPAPQYAPPQPAPVYAPAPQAIACPPGIDPAWFAQQSPEAQAFYASQAAQPTAPAGVAPGMPAQWS